MVRTSYRKNAFVLLVALVASLLLCNHNVLAQEQDNNVKAPARESSVIENSADEAMVMEGEERHGRQLWSFWNLLFMGT